MWPLLHDLWPRQKGTPGFLNAGKVEGCRLQLPLSRSMEKKSKSILKRPWHNLMKPRHVTSQCTLWSEGQIDESIQLKQWNNAEDVWQQKQKTITRAFFHIFELLFIWNKHDRAFTIIETVCPSPLPFSLASQQASPSTAFDVFGKPVHLRPWDIGLTSQASC